MLSYDRVREVADAAAAIARDVAELLARVQGFLKYNTAQAVLWTPATKTFTADATANTGTSNGHGLLNGQKARVTTTGTLPAPLLADTDYWLVGVTANTWQFAATKGGAAIDLTTAGTGTLTLNPVPDYINEEAAGSSGPGNLSGRLFTRIDASNAIGSLDELQKLLNNIAAATGDHMGNLNKLAKPVG
jgi:hypothetical protein